MPKIYFNTLRVLPSATEQEVKAAYAKRLAELKLKYKNNKIALDRELLDLNLAYGVVVNPRLRAEYIKLLDNRYEDEIDNETGIAITGPLNTIAISQRDKIKSHFRSNNLSDAQMKESFEDAMPFQPLQATYDQLFQEQLDKEKELAELQQKEFTVFVVTARRFEMIREEKNLDLLGMGRHQAFVEYIANFRQLAALKALIHNYLPDPEKSTTDAKQEYLFMLVSFLKCLLSKLETPLKDNREVRSRNASRMTKINVLMKAIQLLACQVNDAALLTVKAQLGQTISATIFKTSPVNAEKPILLEEKDESKSNDQFKIEDELVIGTQKIDMNKKVTVRSFSRSSIFKLYKVELSLKDYITKDMVSKDFDKARRIDLSIMKAKETKNINLLKTELSQHRNAGFFRKCLPFNTTTTGMDILNQLIKPKV